MVRPFVLELIACRQLLRSLSHPSFEEKRMATRTMAKKGVEKKSSGRKYSLSAAKNVATEMREMKAGKLRSGHSGKIVTNPKQAIAIELSEARRAGTKVPAKKS
jgi:hypothetical protein